MSQAFKKTDHNALTHRDKDKQHPISAIDGLTEELNGKVPVERTVNGQTLDKDVEIKEVESANKLKTARAINGVAFDGTEDIKIYGESELPLQRKIIKAKGWYRFANITSTGASAIIWIARNYGNGYPEVYTMIFDTTYDNCEIALLSSRFVSHSRYITKIRTVFDKGNVYLELYYSGEEQNAVTTKVLDVITSSINDSFSSVYLEDGFIPEGYTTKEFELSATPMKVSSLQIGGTTLTETQLQSLLNLLT